MRLTAIDYGLRDMTNCGIGVFMGSARDGLAGAFIPTHKPYQNGYGLVANFSAWIGGQDVDQVCHHVGNAKCLGSAPLAGKTVQGAEGEYGILRLRTRDVPTGTNISIYNGLAGAAGVD